MGMGLGLQASTPGLSGPIRQQQTSGFSMNPADTEARRAQSNVAWRMGHDALFGQGRFAPEAQAQAPGAGNKILTPDEAQNGVPVAPPTRPMGAQPGQPTQPGQQVAGQPGQSGQPGQPGQPQFHSQNGALAAFLSNIGQQYA